MFQLPGLPAGAVLIGSRWQLARWYWPQMPHALTSGLQNTATFDAIGFYLNRPMVLDGLALRVTVAGSAGSRVRALVSDDDGNSYPRNHVADTGQINAESASVKEVTGLGVTLPRGIFWLCGGAQGAPATNPTMSWVAVGVYNPLMSIGTASSLFGLGTVPHAYVANLGEGVPISWPAGAGISGSAIAVAFKFSAYA